MFFLLVSAAAMVIAAGAVTYFYGYWNFPDVSVGHAPSKKIEGVHRSAAEAEDAIHDLTASTFKAMTDAAVRRRSP
ncbi:MAG TPA: hypothetical protein VNA20_16320 [Frankiaceae bacterium]|nr:hypothetical protein [Frankiaceae bacterium]